MDFILNIIKTDLIIIFILIHFSLLFCDQKCFYDFSLLQNYLPPNFISLLAKFFAFLPVPLTTIQGIAQFLILGDIAYIVLGIASFLNKILLRLLSLVLFALMIVLIIYIIGMYMQSPIASQVIEDLRKVIIQTIGKIKGEL